VCDARELPFIAEFDAVFSNATLHWIPEAGRVASGITRALKPGGRFVAEFGGYGNVRNVVAALDTGLTRLAIRADDVNPWYYPSIAEYSAVLEEQGLEVRLAMLFDRPTKLEDGENGFAQWIRMFCSEYLDRVATEKREEYLRTVADAARPALW